MSAAILTTQTTRSLLVYYRGDLARPPPIRELNLTCMGYLQSRPVPTAIVGEQLVIYEAFPCYGLPEHQLKVRFRRVPHDVIIRSRKR